MTDFKMVPIGEIRPDPGQPRKYYDSEAMTELATSIQEKGILQPLLIRPNGKGYILVCGERRFRAAGTVGLKEVPAVIRELTDEEALELQIIENLQRKDVHPLEEAVAFNSLLEKGKDIKEIAHRVGKSDRYIRQRMKLNELSKEWQKAFYQDRISVTDAIVIAAFDPATQKELLKNEGDRNGKISFNQWTLSKYRGKLSEATFALDDATLDKKAPPCTLCPFNSAVASLFPGDEDSARCSKPSCFANKTQLHFQRELAIAAADPEIILVNPMYSPMEPKELKAIEKDGNTVLNGTSKNNFTVIEPPEKPDWDSYDIEDWDSEKEMREEYEGDVREYEKELTDFTKKAASGKFKKAFVVNGNNKGKYVFLTLGKATAGSGSKTSKSTDTDELTAEDITNEISRIRDREKRTKEIDQQKVWGELKSQFNPETNVPYFEDKLSQLEREAAAEAIRSKLSFGGRDGFNRLFVPKGAKKDRFSKVTEKQLDKMIRYFFLDVLPPSILYRGFTDDALLCLKLAGQYFPSVLKEKMDAQNSIAEKRNERIEKRIKELQAKKKELTPKAAAKKGSPAAGKVKKAVAKK